MSISPSAMLLIALAVIASSAHSAASASTAAAGSVADFSISIGNGIDEIETGQLVAYQIVAESNGPSGTSGTVTVNFPFGLSNCAWTCTAGAAATCAVSGNGDINETIYLPAPTGGPSIVTFTASCLVATSIPIPPPMTLSVPATVVADAVDPDDDNNAANDTDALIPVVDVAVTIDDGVDHAWFGRTLNYRIGVFTEGADAIVRVVNSVPSTLANCNWTCQSLIGSFCPTPASGSGNIDAELTLPAWSGGLTEMVRFSSTCSLSSTAFFDVVNSVQLQLMPPFRDDHPANNQASDTDLIRRSVDLSATITDGLQYVQVGDHLDYMIRIENAGPDNAEFTYVFDALPSGVSNGIWSCTASPGATCNEGVGDILDDAVNIPVGGQVTYLFSGIVQQQTFTAPIANSVSAFSDLETHDPTPGNNIATDSPPDIVVLFRAGFEFPPPP